MMNLLAKKNLSEENAAAVWHDSGEVLIRIIFEELSYFVGDLYCKGTLQMESFQQTEETLTVPQTLYEIPGIISSMYRLIELGSFCRCV